MGVGFLLENVFGDFLKCLDIDQFDRIVGPYLVGLLQFVIEINENLVGNFPFYGCLLYTSDAADDTQFV